MRMETDMLGNFKTEKEMGKEYCSMRMETSMLESSRMD